MGKIQMIARVTILFAGLLATAPAMAQSIDLTGKDFAFSCFEGTRGVGRVENDGSVAGSIQINGTGPVQPIRLPPRTLIMKDKAVCADLKSSKSESCFDFVKTSEDSFRVSLPGLSIAHCDFVQQNVVGMKEEKAGTLN
jgi:hypothetical protein